MRFEFFKKCSSLMLISLILSFVIGKLILKSWVYFIFSMSFFGALYILIGWILYLKTDGIRFFKNSIKISKVPVDKASIFAYFSSGLFLLVLSQALHSLIAK